MPRECIRKFFPKRKCFVFDRPTNNRQQLLHIEELPDDQLDRNFLEQSKNFCSYIFDHAKTKTLSDGITVTGGGESLRSQPVSLGSVHVRKLCLLSGFVSNCLLLCAMREDTSSCLTWKCMSRH